MEHGTIISSGVSPIEVHFKMDLYEAKLMHDWLVISQDSLQQQIEGLLSAYPRWKPAVNRSKVEEHLDKACLQHNMIITMEKVFRRELEKKGMKLETSSKPESQSGTEQTSKKVD